MKRCKLPREQPVRLELLGPKYVDHCGLQASDPLAANALPVVLAAPVVAAG
jgi:hypothetical protein